MTPSDSLPDDPTVLTPPRIMIVDDMPENLTLINNMLCDQGYEVLALPSGPLALRAAQRIVPDLVLLDISMPEMDGYAVCAHFKSDPKLCDVPIIFLTAHHGAEEKIKGFRAGAVDFITKPFQYEEVHARVMTHIKIHKLQKRLEYQNENLQELVDAKAKQLAEAQVSLLTEQRLRIDAVKKSRQRLDVIAHLNRNATSTVYSAAIAHELNQPLAAILSNAEAAELFLKMDPPHLKEVEEILADIRRDDKRASDLIKRMRDLLKKSESEFQDVNINDIVQDVMNFLAAVAKMRGVTLIAETEAPDLPVSADRIQLQQVLINLVINSMDAMAEIPAIKRVVSIRTANAGTNQVEIAVSDSGTGFSDNIDHVFESFFTTKIQGMGLGLSITAAIIQAHGGRIAAENLPEGGAVVRFTLPRPNSTQ